ncbi:MAG: YARHG domain-containing protein [Armatimonadota bacterium]
MDPAPDAENSEPEEPVDEEAEEDSGSFKLGTEMVPESDDRLIDRTDLEDLDNWGLTLARNEIFARHGRTFENEHLRDYFVGQPWYTPDPNYEREWLSATEEANVEFILEYQQIKYEIPAHQPR